ncbi:MAG: 16S rRNA (cytidine(1402)-2'-O)-methyltransferase [Clostridiales bacterium]|nr:16S rRNA (cytidine(1402)-2'-O)-methyltransferase [Clostridiales bacterium]
MLYLVGTPIGNMGDISPRAVELLASCDLIACEDTRRTGLLLKSIGVENKLFSYHEHNKAAIGSVIIDRLKNGDDICLVSDAGMPSISDPGEDLVKLCVEEEIEVSVVPGPVAAISALVLSGLDTRRYHFEGFLPSENKPRKERLAALKTISETMIIYEAPHRLTKLIDELIANGFGDSNAAFCRELTKKYEQVLRFTVNAAKDYFASVPPKGEFVVCLSPLPVREDDKADIDIDEMISELEAEGLSTKEIAACVSKATGLNKKDIYNHIIER